MKRNTYLSERTLGKGTRFKIESQEKVGNNQPQREPARRNPRRKIWCTEKQAVEVQEIINEVFGNSKICEEQMLEAHLMQKCPYLKLIATIVVLFGARKTSKSPELSAYRVLNLPKLPLKVKSCHRTPNPTQLGPGIRR